MSLLPFFTWCEKSAIGEAIRNSQWLFPVIESVHLLALVLIVWAVARSPFGRLFWGRVDSPAKFWSDTDSPAISMARELGITKIAVPSAGNAASAAAAYSAAAGERPASSVAAMISLSSCMTTDCV